MKTSNKLMLSALIVFLISLTVYNFALKAEYLTGNYKLPYIRYSKTSFKDFKEIQLNAANMVDVEFKQGPFAVYVHKKNQDSVQINQVGNRLVIDVDLKQTPEMAVEYREDGQAQKYINESRYNNIIIVCPNLSLLKTDDAFLVKGKRLDQYRYTDGSNYSSHRMIELEKFKLDSLTLEQKGRSQVSLSANVIKNLSVDAGRQSSTIIRGNVIGNLNLNIRAGAELSLGKLSGFNGDLYNKLNYQVSDSARVTLNGATLKSLIKPKL